MIRRTAVIMFTTTISPIVYTHADLTYECAITNSFDFDRSANTKNSLSLPLRAPKIWLTDNNPYRDLLPRRDLTKIANTEAETNDLAMIRVTHQTRDFLNCWATSPIIFFKWRQVSRRQPLESRNSTQGSRTMRHVFYVKQPKRNRPGHRSRSSASIL